MSSSNSRLDSLVRVLGSEVFDNLIALCILGVFLIVSFDYEGPVGQFPRVFVTAAFVLMLINLAINVAPDPYGTSLEMFTQGVTDMATADSEERLASRETEEAPESTLRDRVVRGLGMIGILGGYFVLAYLIGFVYPIPLLVFVILYLYGDGGIVLWILMTVLLTVLVYYLFGQLMYVPVMNGELL